MQQSAALAFAPVKRESTRDKVYSAVREAILTGQVRSGQRLVEIPLAKQFDVSRAVVREALQQLAHEGLVEQNSYKGTHVVSLTPHQVDEIVHVRLLLECNAVALAAANLTAHDKAELRERARKMAAERDATQFSQMDFELHRRVWDFSGNATMASLLAQVAAPLFAMSLLMRNAERRRSAPMNRRGDHTPLVDAICSGDGKKASEAMRFHLTENWATLKRRLAEFLEREGAEA